MNHADATNKFIDQMKDNTFILFGNVDPPRARFFFKIRGADTLQIGEALGNAALNLQQQIDAFRAQVKTKFGDEEARSFDEAVNAGRGGVGKVAGTRIFDLEGPHSDGENNG